MSPHHRKARLLVVLASLAALVAAASGCGTTKADVERGRTLFVQNCGTCHKLAEAGSSGQVGPDLDAAFAAARAVGETNSTIEGVVKAQVENPRPRTDNPAVSMPPDIVSGTDLEDVAAYVGLYAGVPGAAPPTVSGGPGAQVFANNGCGGCHTLAAANAGGTTGPDLDEVLPGVTQARLKTDIVDPNAKIATGYPANVMPSNFGNLLSEEELNDLISYLIESTSGGGKSKGG
jgi:mono/diheme cytochrome c family protein